MIIIRAIIGFFKTLVNLWSWNEWRYNTRTGFDPKVPAFKRWEVFLKSESKAPETETERLLPTKNNWIILRDKFMQSPDEVLFYNTDKDKVEALMEEYEREMRSRTSGEFYYKMVKGRNLDFIHTFRASDAGASLEGTEIDAEQEREKFLR